MSIGKKLSIVLIIMVMLVGGMGFSFQPAQASGCAYYHVVRAGESLSWIARWYGAYWPYLAQINNIPAPRYRIYPGQTLCIAYGGYNVGYGGKGVYYPPYTTYTGYINNWSFSVTNVQKDTSVTVHTYNVPSNVILNAKMGRTSGSSYEWLDLPNVDTSNGGSFDVVFAIPAAFAGTPQLVIRMIQQKKNGKVFQYDQWFNNIPSGTGIGGYNSYSSYNPYYYNYYGHSTIPTIWIASVAANSSVTITTANFPPNLDFQVLMGPMGTHGYGYYVTSFNSGAGGSMSLTFPIPPQLYGAYQISIRTQNPSTGFFSYNWFYNNTTY